ncbi:hypothetical protein [uncultured Aquimarina sp.]|uniref:hypothetical protein n=1 Tax=uncultured Aquimarina sp. TaxID=575652 RepID=UPI00262C3256|nr:hypothetical protein [uncultured Aquimarina sp.]
MFYILRNAQKRGEAVLEWVNKDFERSDLILGKSKGDQPSKFKIAMGKRLYDANFFNDGINKSISQEFLKILKDNALKGWDVYNLEMDKPKDKRYGLQVTGRCGKLIKPEQKGFYIGYNFDHNSWDGSDFFCPEGTALIFCTEKAKDILTKSKISNIEFEDITKVKAYSSGK